jgi:carbon starvation protein
MMVFIWIALVYVIVAFTDITAGSFVRGTEELEGSGVAFNPGGAVAAASVLYLALALVMGVVQRFLAPPLWLVTVIFVPATFALVVARHALSTGSCSPHRTWALAILAYCLPSRRSAGVGAAAAARLSRRFRALQRARDRRRRHAVRRLRDPAAGVQELGHRLAGGQLFPFLFVTIACGACSGFHGLVCSGTTSKQVERESHAHFVGYGAMLAEAFVALIALVTVDDLHRRRRSSARSPARSTARASASS